MIKHIAISLLVIISAAIAQRVDYIEYNVLPVFDEDDDYWGHYDYRWMYGVLNKLHVRSRPYTIGRFLSFDVGDSLTPLSISESERILRNTQFIGEANVAIHETDSGNVASVTVTDLWTTKLSPSFAYKGRVLEWKVEVEEVNLAGLGVYIRAAYDHDEDFDSWIFGLGLPRMLPGGSSIRLSHSDATEVVGPTSSGFSFYRGRRSDSEKIIYHAGMSTVGGEYPTWFDGNVSGPSYMADDYRQFASAKYLFDPRFGIGLGLHRSSVIRTKIGDDFPDEIEKNERKLEIIPVGVSLLNRRFTIDSDVDGFGRTEDIPSGWQLVAECGFDTDFDIKYTKGYTALAGKIGPVHSSLNCSFKRLDKTETVGIGARFFTDKFLSGRLCGRAVYMSISGGFPENYYRVGGQSCLRSYRSFAQVGDKTIFGNLEWRVFTPVEFFSVRLGGAAFVDAGSAWDGSDGEFDILSTPKQLIGDVGLEIRLASMSSTTGQIARLSIARAFDGSWEFTLAAGQLFRTYIGFEHGAILP